MEYSDSESPVITTTKSVTQPHSTAAGRRTQSLGGHDELWWDEDMDDMGLTSVELDSADTHIAEILSDPHGDEVYHDSQEHGEFIEDGQFEDIDGYHGNHGVRQESQGDTDEWEDCETEEFIGTQSSEGSLTHVANKVSLKNFLPPEEDIRININLNPDAPIFTPVSPSSSVSSPLSPLSPGMMKTPEGHVKVPDWAAEMKTPTSVKKNISFSSASPGSNTSSPDGKADTESKSKAGDANKETVKDKSDEKTDIVDKGKDDTADAVSEKDIGMSEKNGKTIENVASDAKEEGGNGKSKSESEMAKPDDTNLTNDTLSNKTTNGTEEDSTESQKGPEENNNEDPSPQQGKKDGGDGEVIVNGDSEGNEGSTEQSESQKAKGVSCFFMFLVCENLL